MIRPFLRLARILLPLLIVVVVAGLIYFFVARARSGAVYGAAVALCPGPDRYGYTCEGAEGYAYIDATADTELELDDGVITLALPFPFTFYGTVYSEVGVSVNGNLQFTTNNATFRHSCLAGGPAPALGDMIAPYWSDLDLRAAGVLETITVGVAPQRIFVVEWDGVPRFGDGPEETVTFEVQLFEGSNDIVFLYEDATSLSGSNGSSALVGVQSELQGTALQYSCNQPVVGNGDALRITHPAEPNPDLGMGDGGEQGRGGAGEMVRLSAMDGLLKEPVATLAERLAGGNRVNLEGLRGEWLSAHPQRAFVWQWLDLTGDGQEELVALWFGRPSRPDLAEVVVLGSTDGSPGFHPLLHEPLATRTMPVGEIGVAETKDLTGDGRADALLHDRSNGRLWVVAAPQAAEAEAARRISLFSVPELCEGSLIIVDTNGDRVAEIVRDGCNTPGRVHVSWDGRAFVLRWDADYSW